MKKMFTSSIAVAVCVNLGISAPALAQGQEENASAQESKTQGESKAPLTLGGFFKDMTDSVNGAINKANESAGVRKRGDTGEQRRVSDTFFAATAATGGSSGIPLPKKPVDLASSIAQSTLAGIFTNNPYDGTPRTHFPRVAVTVTDWSRSDCWTAVATVWKTKSKSESIPPFSVCWGTGLGFAVNNAANLHLFMSQSAIEHSGNVRSLGPKPPMLAIPNQTPMRESQQQHFTGFIQQLVVATGWQPGAPTNMWLVGFDPNGSQRTPAVPVGSGTRAERSVGAAAQEASSNHAGQVISKQCKAENFTAEKYNRIVVGMSFETVKKVIGCEPDPDFSRRGSGYSYHMWQATINNLVAARAIEVFFDANGAKVAPLGKDFKTARGF